MMYISSDQFAASMGIGPRAAQLAFQNAAKGKAYRGFRLPVVTMTGKRGGAGGKVLALSVDRCPAELKAKLGVFEGPFEAPFEDTLNGAVEAWQWEGQEDRLRIIAPALDLEKRSAERASTFRAIAAGFI